MIPNMEIHKLSLTRITKTSDNEQIYMNDEARLICQCGYERAIPLTTKGEFDGEGAKLSKGNVLAEHIYNGIVYF